jgi:GNAT superfamily N-acetyltransferase
LSAAHRAELEGDELDPFDVAGVTLQFRPKERHVALEDERGRLVASTGMVITEVEVAGQRFPVIGIGGVIVTASHRGRGLARQVVEAALARAAELGPPFATGPGSTAGSPSPRSSTRYGSGSRSARRSCQCGRCGGRCAPARDGHPGRCFSWGCRFRSRGRCRAAR